MEIVQCLVTVSEKSLELWEGKSTSEAGLASDWAML